MTTIILLIILIVIGISNIVLTVMNKTVGISEEQKDILTRIDANVSKFDSMMRDEFSSNRGENQKSFKDNREELSSSFKILGDTLTQTVAILSNAQKNQFDTFSKQLSDSLKSFEERFTQSIKEFNDLQQQKFGDLVRRQEIIKNETEGKLKEIRETVENKLIKIQEDNNKKLEEMRKVVDEKLHETVEKRFNESFKLISERLEQVHKGLGEMQTLASGVGDLKKVLTNVKTRGSIGEIQLGAILEQFLSPEQYEQNAAVRKGSQERVEYVIKLPGKNNDDTSLVLPIDSKFPIKIISVFWMLMMRLTLRTSKQLLKNSKIR